MNISHSKPFLPPIEAYHNKVQQIWDNVWLTNHGPMVEEFEEKIAAFLGLRHVSYVSSGTMGLQCALRTLPRGGEIITTPYSYVATASAVFWEGYTPVFADIDPANLALDPKCVAAKIGPKTVGVLATHVYGIPADCDGLEALCSAHGLPLMYDGAHAFGVKHKGKSLLAYGDISVLSLHATKVFHTANGGLVVCKNEADKKRIDQYRNFGHNGPNHFSGPGINGKNSELHAALGLSMLPYADEVLQKRRSQWTRYRELLSGLDQKHFVQIDRETVHNGAYFPILQLPPTLAGNILKAMDHAGVEARRYFNPSLNTIEYLRGDACPISEQIADTVFCLPLHHHLSASQQEEIAEIVLKHF